MSYDARGYVNEYKNKQSVDYLPPIEHFKRNLEIRTRHRQVWQKLIKK